MAGAFSFAPAAAPAAPVSFSVDSTSPANGAIVTLPSATLDVHFNEPFDPATVATSNLSLSQGAATAAAVLDATTARYTIAGLSSETIVSYTLAAGALKDAAGNPSTAYTGSFVTDIGAVAYPTPLVARAPLGSMVYNSVNPPAGAIGTAGDTDSFTLGLDAGQDLSVLVSPGSGLQPTVEVTDPSGNVLGTATATAAGKPALLETLPVVATGTYTLTVGGAAGTTGVYFVAATLNAALQASLYGGASNDTLATAQNLDPAFVSLGTLGSAGTSGVTSGKASVLGTSGTPGPAVTLLSADFEDGTGGPAPDGFTVNNGATGLWHLSTGRGPQAGHSATHSFYYGQNETSTGGGNYNTGAANAGTLTSPPINLPPGQTTTLDFNYVLQTDGSGTGDQALIQISTDGGATFTNLSTLNGLPTSTWSAAPQLRLSAYAGQTVLLRWSFDTVNAVNNNFEGWYVDDIRVAAAPPPTAYYSFTLAAGDTATLAAQTLGFDVPAVSLYDPNGNLLAQGVPGPSNVQNIVADFLAPASGTYTAAVSGTAGSPYHLMVTRDADFDTEGNHAISLAQPLLSRQVAAEQRLLGNLTAGNVDLYKLTLAAGATLQASTATPADGPGEYLNVFNPRLRLLNSSGATMAFDDNSAPDGHNATLAYAAPSAGTYYVEVSSTTAGATGGDYVLDVKGAGAVPAPAFAVSSSSVPAGARLKGSPYRVTLTFNQPLLLSALQPSAVTIDGLPATACQILSGNSAAFVLPGPLSDGAHTLAVAAGALTDAQGAPVQAYSSGFTVDTVPPKVVASSLQEGGVVAPGNLTYTVTFSEPMAIVDGREFSLKGLLRNVSYAPASFSFNSAGPAGPAYTVLTINYSNLPEDNYTLTLVSGPNAFADAAGNALDGEPVWPIPSGSAGSSGGGTGNGTAGGNFFVDFAVDVASAPFPTPLSALNPAGSWVYSGTSTAPAVINSAGDTDSYTVNLDAGQTATVVVHPTSAGLQPAVTFSGPGAAASGTTVTAATAGTEAILQTVPVSSAGTYTIQVAGAAGTTGLYTTQFILNAAVESEAHGGGSNNTTATAQNLDAAFVDLPGAAAGARRAAVLGTADPASSDLYALSLTAGQTLSVGVAGLSSGLFSLAILDPSGNVLPPNPGGSTNLGASITDFTAPATGTYFVRVTGSSGVNYNMVALEGAEFEAEPGATSIEQTHTAIGGLTGGPLGDNDFFKFSSAAGSTLSITTSTPGDGPGEFSNPLNPKLVLYDPNNQIVATDDNSAPDGRNASLTYTTSVSGMYSVGVYPSGASGTTTGEYVLNVTGETPLAIPAAPDLLPATDSGQSSTDNYTSFNNSSPDRALQFSVGGTVAGATVTLYMNGVAVGSAAATGPTTLVTTNGTFKLSDNTYSVTARQTLPGQDESPASDALVMGIKASVPSRPAAPQLQATSDAGFSATDGVTNVATPTFDVNEGPYFRVYRDGVLVSGPYQFGSPWTSAPLADGTYRFTITSVDGAGNESAPSAPTTVTVDTAAPAAGSLAAPAVTAVSAAPYTFTVTYSDSLAVDVSSLDGNDVLVTGPNNFRQLATFVSVDTPANGSPRTATYRITPPGGSWDSGDNGTYTVALQPSQVRDIAGNFVPAGILGTFTVSAFSPPGTPDLLAAADSGASSTDNLTNFDNSTPAKALQFSVPGTVAGATVTIYADGAAIGSAVAIGTTTTVNTDGKTALSNGAHAFTARQTPPNGSETADSPALTVTIDTLAPAPPPPDLEAASDSGTSNSDNVTNVTSPTFDLAASEPSTLYLVADGTLSGPPVAAPGAGTYPVTWPPPAPFSLSAPQSFTVPAPNPTVGAVADFNSDGLPDLAVSSATAASGAVLLGSRGSGFQPALPISTSASGTTNLAAGDLNGDGHPDLVSTRGNVLSVRLGNGDGTFQPPLNYSTQQPGTLSAVAIADFNKDGKMDVAASDSSLAPYDVFLGNGDGTLRPPVFGVDAFQSSSLVAGDFNGDGKVDLLTYLLGDIEFVAGNGDGTFKPAVFQYDSAGTVINCLAAGDFNHDGKLDVVAGHSAGGAGTNPTAAVLLGNGDGTFKSPVFIPIAASPTTVTVGDLNGDGNLDFVTNSDGTNVLSAVYGNGDGTFKPAQTIQSAGTRTVGAAIADFNGDGRPDLAADEYNNAAVSLQLGAGGGLSDGTHSFTAWAEDLAGNRSPMSAPLAVTLDTTAPAAGSLAAPDVAAPGGTTYTFTVTYSDNTAVDASTLDNGDVLVTGPGGFSQAATLVSVDAPGNGSPRAATYSITPPGSAWDSPDNGAYTVSLQPSQVRDTAGNFVPAATLGAFTASVYSVLGAPDLLAATDSGASATDNLTSFDNSTAAKALQFAVPGTAAGATVTVYADGVAVGSAVAMGPTTTVTTDGKTALPGGAHSFTARQTAPGGAETVDSAALSVMIDTAAPTAGSLAAPPLTTDGGTTYSFTVTYSDNLSVDASSLGSGNVRVTGPAGFSQLAALVSVDTPGDGSPRTATYQISAPGGSWDPPDSGTYTVSLQPTQVRDTAGNFVPAATLGSFAVAVDSAPGALDLLAATDSGVSSADNLTNFDNGSPAKALQFAVPGIAPGATVTLYADGVAIGSTVAAGGTTTVTTDGTTVLSNGPHSITARQTPPGGTETPDSPALLVTIDTTAPPAPPPPDLEAGSDSGASNSDNVTNVTTPTFDLVAGEAGILHLEMDGGNGTGPSVPTPAASTYPATLGATAGPLSDGVHGFTAWAEDLAGNRSAMSAPLPVTFDTAAPAAVSLAAPDVTSPGGTTYTFTIIYSDNTAVDASSLGDGNVLVTGPAGFSQLATLVSVDTPGDGMPRTATYQITAPGGSWDSPDNGAYTVALQASQVRDTAGNAAPAATLGTFTANVYSAPGAPTLLPASDSGVSSSDTVTNFNNSSAAKALQFSVPGTVAGAAVTLYSDGTLIGTATATGGTTVVTTNGAAPLTNGTHSFTARQAPPGGTATPASLALAVTIDTAAPTAGLSNALRWTTAGTANYTFTVRYVDGSAVDASSLGNANVLVTGPNILSPDNFSQLATLVSVDKPGNGTPRFATYSITPPGGSWDAADNGTYTVALRASQLRDIAGNVAPAATIGTFAVNIVPPPTGPYLTQGTDSGRSNFDQLTNFDNSSPAKALVFLAYSDQAGVPVTVYADGTAIGSGTTDAGGVATIVTNGTAPLTNGPHAFTARQTIGGVQSGDSFPLTVTIDTVAPPAPPTPDLEAASDSGASSTDNVTNVNRPTFDVVTSEAGSIHLTYGGGLSYVVPVTGAGTHAVAYPGPNGAFSPVSDSRTDVFPAAVTVADINLDGKPDVLTANRNLSLNTGTISVLLGNGDGTFQPPRNAIASGSIGRVYTGDLNNDGKPDLITPNGNGTLSIRLGNGDGTSSGFSTTPLAAPNSEGDYLALADFNGDGNLDVAAAQPDTAGGGIALLYGNGDGTFKPKQVLPGPGGYQLLAADINGDGKPDLVGEFLAGTPSGTGTVDTFLNLGNGTFGPAIVAPPVSGRLKAGDFNHDGKPDLALLGGSISSSSVSLLIGNGDGTFHAGGTYPMASQVQFFGVADLNNDGNSDVFTTSLADANPPYNDVTIRYANSDGTLQPAVSIAMGHNPWDIAAADFNGDGTPDLVVGNVADAINGGNTVSVSLGIPGSMKDGAYAVTASFEDYAGNVSAPSAPLPVTIDTTAPTAALSAPAVTAAGATSYTFTVTYSDNTAVDAASLGAGDVLVNGPNGFSQAATLVAVDAGGSGTPRTATYQITPHGGSWDGADDGTYTVSLQPSQVRDVAGNAAAAATLGSFTVVASPPPGAPDLLAATDSGQSSTDNLTNFDNSSAARALQFSVPGTLAGATVTIYADGTAIGSAVASGPTTTVTTNGAVTLSNGTHSITARQARPGSPETADSPPLTVAIDTVAPTPPPPDLEAASDSGISSTDNLTNVNQPTFDVTAGEAGTIRLNYGGITSQLFVTAAGTYPVPRPAAAWPAAAVRDYPTGPAPSDVTIADMNNDGNPDLIVVGQNGTLLLGNADGTFQAPRTIPFPTAPGTTFAGDFNGDGKLDLAAAGFRAFSLVLGNGDGSFGAASTVAVGDDPYTGLSITAADFNGDGKLDVAANLTNIAGGTATGVGVFLGNGDGTFQPERLIRTAATSDVYAADFNGDGKPDLLAQFVNSTGSPTSLGVFLNQGNGNFGSFLTTLATGSEFHTGDFNGDGKLDLCFHDTSSNVTVLLGTGTGTFRRAGSFYMGSATQEVNAADLNGDGKLDIFASELFDYSEPYNNVTIRYGNGDGTFQPGVLVQMGHYSWGVDAADFNHDGTPDLVLANAFGSSTVSVALGSGGALKDGAYNVTATLEDLAGNVSAPSAPLPVTIDTTTPTSSVAALPAASASPFTVSWSGSDPAAATGPGSGVATYTVYVSDNGGPFTPWLSDTALTQSAYAGTLGHSYSFYSVATDTAGNVEAAPATPDATTTVVQAPPALTVGDGTVQRSVVNKLTLAFAAPVTPAAGTFTLEQLTTDAAGNVTSSTDVSAAVTWSNPTGDGTTWVAAFAPDSAAADATGGLLDGVYRLTVHAALLTGASGGPALAGDQTFTFHRLFGDADGNGTVNALDYARFRQAFGSAAGSANYNSAFDSDANGSINALDYAQFKKRFGMTFVY